MQTKNERETFSMVLGFAVIILALPVALLTSSQDLDSWLVLKSKSPSRCLASTEEVCKGQETIASLRSELEKLEKQKKEIVETIEKAEEKQKEDDGDDKVKKEKDELPTFILNQIAAANRAHMANVSVIRAASMFNKPLFRDPVTDRTPEMNMDYLKMVVTNKWSFMMDNRNNPFPQWDSDGLRTNNPYADYNTMKSIRTMHRDPLGLKNQPNAWAQNHTPFRGFSFQ